MPERRACKVLDQNRATQRYAAKPREDELPLTPRIIELATTYGRYGYRTVADLIRNEGTLVNPKRVGRIWRAEGLKVPRKQPKRGRLWLNDGSCIRLRPERPNHVWAYDFVSASTHDGKPLRLLTIVDEFTRECLAIQVARKLSSDDVMEQLTWLFVTHGVPTHLRSDNGSEFTAKAIRAWLERVGTTTLFITPGSPGENGYVESLNGKLRDQLRDREISYTAAEARILIERWRWHYNEVRPHSALGGRPPAPEARRLAIEGSLNGPRSQVAGTANGLTLNVV